MGIRSRPGRVGARARCSDADHDRLYRKIRNADAPRPESDDIAALRAVFLVMKGGTIVRDER